MYYFEEFLILPSFFYHTCGVDLWGPNGGLSRRIVLYLSAINLSITFIAEFYYATLKIKTDLIEATMALTYAAFVMVSITKYYYMISRKNNMYKFLNRLLVIFPRSRTQQEDLCLKYYIKQNALVMKGYTATFLLLIFIYNVYAMLKYFIHTNIKHKHDLEPAVPYEAYYPWDWQHHWSYYLVYLSQSVAGWHAISAQVALDLLLCATATQLLMHYDYISRSLEECQLKFAESRANAKTPAIAKVTMELHAFRENIRYISGIVAYHVELLRLSSLLNDFFGVPLLVNLFTSSAVICFIGFQMTVSRELDLTIKLALFFFSSVIQVYLICHFGQRLMDSSKNIAKAVQFHDWTQAEVRYQRMLIMLTARAQRPACLNATSFLSISLETMTDIMQLSYKIFALIRTMYYD